MAKSTSSQTNQPVNPLNKRIPKKVYIPIFLIIAYGIAFVTPLISPYAQYPYYIMKCGRLPVIASNFAAGYHYYLPGDKYYRVDPFVSEYFCTEKEADVRYESISDY